MFEGRVAPWQDDFRIRQSRWLRGVYGFSTCGGVDSMTYGGLLFFKGHGYADTARGLNSSSRQSLRDVVQTH